ncbi:hypothetical protein [Vibrio barjaei]|uniref:hypothetical protein n=1 Tax=Vibrio barjaei TaxID=1676683 RepID=UPI0022853476|nr:hypothetical protein [Vibrio barjaei]MCY9870413.1 hypothetical protein [Vibrio barjaei]
MDTKEILKVSKVFKEGSEYIADCPHCQKLVGIEGELNEIKGEQFHHNGLFGCDGWFEVERNVRRVDSINELVRETKA